MTDSTYQTVFLSPEEVELIELLRGDGHEGDFSLTISRQAGHVAIGLKLPKYAGPGEGDGATFPEAWSKIAPYWA